MPQACLPVKDLDLGYNLVKTHDGRGAFGIVDHDELDPVSSKARMSTVYGSGQHLDPSYCDALKQDVVACMLAIHCGL